MLGCLIGLLFSIVVVVIAILLLCSFIGLEMLKLFNS